MPQPRPKPTGSGQGSITVTLPPPSGGKKKGPPSPTTALDLFIKAHPALGAYKGIINSAASQYHMDAVWLASILWFESKGNPYGPPSKKGAVGIAQIADKSASAQNIEGVPFFRPNQLAISDADKRNPQFAIFYAAWRLSAYVHQYGYSDDTYRQGYNDNYKGDNGWPSQTIPPSLKSYAYGGGGTAAYPAGGAPQAAPTVPKSYYDDISMYYIGRRLSQKEYEAVSAAGLSDYGLKIALSHGKYEQAFYKGPLYKNMALGYQAIWHDMMGQGKGTLKADPALIRRAILHQWDGATFQEAIRQSPFYLQSNEYKTNVAQFDNIYQSIYGVPDENGKLIAREAALQRWSPDQFAGYLRGQPQYTRSPEYLTKALTFMDQLGVVFGTVPTLTEGQLPANNQPGGFGPLKDTSRVAGTPQAPVPTLPPLTPVMGG